jgi:site-specific DNA-methyltransferase (adenine-specific)
MSDYTLHHGDCLDVLPTLAPQSIDAVICDPPYGTTACKWDSVIPFEPMWEGIKRVLRPRGAIVLFGSQPFTSALVMSNPDQYSHSWVWNKSRASGFLDANRKPLKIHEDIIVFALGYTTYNPQKEPCARRFEAPGGRAAQYNGGFERRPLRAYDDRFPTTVLSIGSHAAATVLHPTQKPLALLEYLIRTYTNEGDTVLDFAFGSGTTGAACGNLGRRFVGIEKDLNYFTLGSERIATAYAPLRAMQVAS